MKHCQKIQTLISELHGLIYQFNCERKDAYMFCELGKNKLRIGISTFEGSKFDEFAPERSLTEADLQTQIDEIKEMLR